jgi:hypothetical protein
MQHARQDEIGDELPASRQQALILAPLHGASDEAGRFFADHLLHLPWQPVEFAANYAAAPVAGQPRRELPVTNLRRDGSLPSGAANELVSNDERREA